MKNNRNKAWTTAHSKKAQNLHEMGVDSFTIGEQLGRTSHGVSVHLSKLRNNYVRPKVKPALKPVRPASIGEMTVKQYRQQRERIGRERINKVVMPPVSKIKVAKTLVINFITSIAGGALGVWIALNLIVVS